MKSEVSLPRSQKLATESSSLASQKRNFFNFHFNITDPNFYKQCRARLSANTVGYARTSFVMATVRSNIH
jgi:hypothetical protein